MKNTKALYVIMKNTKSALCNYDEHKERSM